VFICRLGDLKKGGRKASERSFCLFGTLFACFLFVLCLMVALVCLWNLIDLALPQFSQSSIAANRARWRCARFVSSSLGVTAGVRVRERTPLTPRTAASLALSARQTRARALLGPARACRGHSNCALAPLRPDHGGMHKGGFRSLRNQDGFWDGSGLHSADHVRDAATEASHEGLAADRPAGRGGCKKRNPNFGNGGRAKSQSTAQPTPKPSST
jgi:hypothetical protein